MLFPGRPSSTALLWWELGPRSANLRVEPADPTLSIAWHDLGRLGSPRPDLGPRVIAASGLREGTEYRLISGGESCLSRTLPSRVVPGRPFVAALGSCYYHSRDPGVAAVYDGRYRRAGPWIDLRFLCGDQLYMDLADGLGGKALPTPWKAPDVWQKYLDQWPARDFPKMMAATPTLLQGDDHEFWNDFPHEKAWIWWANKNPASPIRQQLDAVYRAFQVAMNLPADLIPAGTPAATIDNLLNGPARSFSIDVPPLSFFVLDLRSRRTVHDDPVRTELAPAAEIVEMRQWAAALTGPGVLVVPQPIAIPKASSFERVTHIKGDWALSDYDESYGAILSSLFAAPHDILVLSGDIHWSRCYRLWQTEAGRHIYEVVSSPMRLMLGDKPPDPDRVNKAEGKVEWRGAAGSTEKAFWRNLLAAPVTEPATWATLEFTVPQPPSQPLVQVRAEFWGVRTSTAVEARSVGSPAIFSLR